MLDFNDLRVFEKVAALRSFSAAARALGQPKSSVSRGVARLEVELGVRLLQRTTREVVLTEPGRLLQERCAEIMAQVARAADQVTGLGAEPRGRLRVSAGIGFGVNVLSEVLPRFLDRHPGISVSVDLTSRLVDLVGEEIDVAIRLGPMPDSRLVARRLGAMRRFLCASPDYLERRGTPRTPDDLRGHDTVEMPGGDGRPRPWLFTAASGDKVVVEVPPRLTVNEAVTIQRLVVNGAGLGILSGYLCAPSIATGRLVRLLPEWTLPPMEVSVAFPSNRELASAVRAFVDFLKHESVPGQGWLDEAVPG